MSQFKTSNSERTSIHDMLKDIPPNENKGTFLPFSNDICIGNLQSSLVF